MWYENLLTGDWVKTDPAVFDFKTRFTPITLYTGVLAESWEIQDFQNVIFHIRKGVHFQNIPPVNGREMTAYDVEYCWHRLLGLGSGFTKPSSYVTLTKVNLLTSVNATDKYTVVVKFKSPSITQCREVMEDFYAFAILPREAIEKWGDLNDWRRCIGTGPFIMQEYVPGSSVSAVRNPNYWGYDEYYPEDRLPYVDNVRILILPDDSTADAGMRTGKIDMSTSVTWERAASFKKTNPQVLMANTPGSAIAIYMQVDKKPYNDIRVRKAMQMALDLKTIATSYYGGTGTGKPPGAVGTSFKGFCAEYDDWPQVVKDGYAYNPEVAKALLKEAGYPNGFKCSLVCTAVNVDVFSVMKSYFEDIGIDMVLDVKETGAFNNYTAAGMAEMSQGAASSGSPPLPSLAYYTSTSATRFPLTHINDSVYDVLWAKADASLDAEEQRRLTVEADLYTITQHWTVNLVPTVTYNVYQPWVKRYKGIALTERYGPIFARLWIDQALKKSMGR